MDDESRAPAPAVAGDKPSLSEEVAALRHQVQALEAVVLGLARQLGNLKQSQQPPAPALRETGPLPLGPRQQPPPAPGRENETFIDGPTPSRAMLITVEDSLPVGYKHSADAQSRVAAPVPSDADVVVLDRRKPLPPPAPFFGRLWRWMTGRSLQHRTEGKRDVREE